jgi:hypothetical protein
MRETIGVVGVLAIVSGGCGSDSSRIATLGPGSIDVRCPLVRPASATTAVDLRRHSCVRFPDGSGIAAIDQVPPGSCPVPMDVPKGTTVLCGSESDTLTTTRPSPRPSTTTTPRWAAATARAAELRLAHIRIPHRRPAVVRCRNGGAHYWACDVDMPGSGFGTATLEIRVPKAR